MIKQPHAWTFHIRKIPESGGNELYPFLHKPKFQVKSLITIFHLSLPPGARACSGDSRLQLVDSVLNYEVSSGF